MEKRITTIKYFEVAIKDEEMPIPNDEDPISYVIKGIRKPTFEEAHAFLNLKTTQHVISVSGISKEEAYHFFDMYGAEQLPVFGK